jgi:hypothetical protein
VKETEMAKTYIPALYFVLKHAHRYATRYQPQLQQAMTEQQYNCLVAVIAAIAECLPLILPPPLND